MNQINNIKLKFYEHITEGLDIISVIKMEYSDAEGKESSYSFPTLGGSKSSIEERINMSLETMSKVLPDIFYKIKWNNKLKDVLNVDIS